MKKAVLVINMPRNCGKCDLWEKEYDCGCNYYDFQKRPSECPLKPLPQKKEVESIETIDDFMQTEITSILNKCIARVQLDTELLLATGYNKCLDEILGEENE